MRILCMFGINAIKVTFGNELLQTRVLRFKLPQTASC
jgi:hypothetical protein